jgi:hypothetical protein
MIETLNYGLTHLPLTLVWLLHGKVRLGNGRRHAIHVPAAQLEGPAAKWILANKAIRYSQACEVRGEEFFLGLKEY